VDGGFNHDNHEVNDMENTHLKGFSAGIFTSAQAINPWVSMWTRPRETVRHLLVEGQDGRMLVLASLAGIAQVLGRASGRDAGDHMEFSTILLLALALGPLAGLGALYFWSWLTAWTGRVLDGVGDAESIRIPMAWAGLPTAAGLAIWAIVLALLGPELFTAETPRLDANPALGSAFLVLMLGWVVLGVWSVVLMAKGVAEVQGYDSAWRGLANLVLGGLVMLGTVIVLAVCLFVVLR
jgi:hypothetical protein